MAESVFSVGNVEVLALTDIVADFQFPLSQSFSNVPEGGWAQYEQRYAEVFSGPDSWRVHFGCYLLRSQGRTILVNTGVGSSGTNPGMVASLGAGDGSLMADLEEAGVRSEDVDTVFFTHLHPDHVGWNLSQGGAAPRAMFPRARYVVHQADWDNFGNPQVREQLPMKYWDETLAPLETLGLLDLISGERALTSEITAINTPGHTPGHMSLAIISGGKRAVIMGDAAVHPAQVTEVDWCFGFESDQVLATRTRTQLFDRIEAEDAALIACHFPAPGFGRLVRVEGRRYWEGF